MKHSLKKLLATLMTTTIVATTMVTPVFADQSLTNPTSASIPLTATIDNYYEISCPATISFVRKGVKIGTIAPAISDSNSQADMFAKCDISAIGNLASGAKLTVTVKAVDMTSAGTHGSPAAADVVHVGRSEWKTSGTYTSTDFTTPDRTLQWSTLSTSASVQSLCLHGVFNYSDTYNGSMQVNFGVTTN